MDNGTVLVVLRRTSKTGICPICKKRCRFINTKRIRRIRDLDIADSKVYLEFMSYEIDCTCGYLGFEDIEFCDEYSRYTKRFEEKIVVLCIKMCIKDVAEEMRMSWGAVKNIDKKKAREYIVDLESLNSTRIGIDEIAYQKGHKYLTVVRDVDLGKVVFVGEGRRKETLDDFFRKLGIIKSWKIKEAVCDMWDPYIASIKANTDAAIIFDKFHVAKVINEAVDDVRKKEFAKADREERMNMKHKRFLILSRRKNLNEAKKETLSDLLLINDSLYAAYILKEQILDIFDEKNYKTAVTRINKWLRNVKESGIEQFTKATRRIENYLYGILNYFIYGLTNGQSEGFNNKINIIKRRAYGFRDLEYFKLKILQTCGLNSH